MKGHLKSFIAVFVVVVVDDMLGVDIYLGKAISSCPYIVHDLVMSGTQVMGRYFGLPAEIVHASIDGV